MIFSKILSKYYLILFIFFLIACKTETPVIQDTAQQKADPPSPVSPIVISYNIEPDKFIRDDYGYIGIKYYTHDQEKEKIRIRLEKKNAGTEDFDKAYKKIPEFGYIVLHIGRQDLMHANTKWYSGSVKKDNVTVYNYKGREGIPNIKGEDGNWWNIVKLPLREDINNSLSVIIKDHKTGNSYNFKINRIGNIQ